MSTLIVPPVISQVGYPAAGDIDDCWVVATVWAAVAADPHAIRPTVTEFRAHAGRPDRRGPTGGTLAHVLRGSLAQWPHLAIAGYESSSWDVFEKRLRAGRIASLGVTSAELPANLQFGFRGGHQIGVVYINGQWLVANPLARDGAKPIACPVAYLQAAARRHGGGKILAALFEPWEGSMVMFDPAGNEAIGVSTVLRDTQLIRLDGARVPFPAGTRNVYLEAEPEVAGGRKAYLVTYRGVGHWLVADDRQKFVAAKGAGGDVKHRIYLSVDGQARFDEEV
jgi:hypothetical protein